VGGTCGVMGCANKLVHHYNPNTSAKATKENIYATTIASIADWQGICLVIARFLV